MQGVSGLQGGGGAAILVAELYFLLPFSSAGEIRIQVNHNKFDNINSSTDTHITSA